MITFKHTTLLASSLTVGLLAVLPLSQALAQGGHDGHHPRDIPVHKQVTPKPDAATVSHDKRDVEAGQMRLDADHSQMNHGNAHGEHMHHGHMPSADQSTQSSRTPILAPTDTDRAAAFPSLPPHVMHEGGTNYFLLADKFEWQDADAGNALAWDLNGWIGGDIDRLAFRSEGERIDGHTVEAELQLLWSHAIGPWWEAVAGARQDFKPGPAQTWAAFGVQGMPLFGLETEATAFIGEGGQTAARLMAEYDIRLSNRLILQPAAEANMFGRNDEERGAGAGFSDVRLGLRLRYEIRREFAPYIGVNWTRAYGNSADMLREVGDDASEARLVAGIRLWL